MSVITLDNQIVHYEVLGRGRPIIFLHGWIGSWRYWVPTMQAISVQYRAYALDLWGYGDSSKKTDKYGLEAQVELIDQFMEYLGISKTALVGHGLGGLIGMSFALRFPQYVDRLLLTGLPVHAEHINARFRSSTIPELSEWLFGRLPNMDEVLAEASKTDLQALLLSLDGLHDFDVLENVKNLTSPFLMVYGQNDIVIEPPDQGVLEGLPENSHTVIFDQSGHLPMLEESSKFNRLLSDFLNLGSGESPKQLQLKEEWKRRIR